MFAPKSFKWGLVNLLDDADPPSLLPFESVVETANNEVIIEQALLNLVAI
jgi:hypothetical protein